MNINTRIYGYVGDGFIACNACAATLAKEAVAEQAGIDVEDLPECFDPNGEAYELAGLSGLLEYHDTTACGERCDCGAEVFEEAEDHGIGEPCRDCGYEADYIYAIIIDPHGRRTIVHRTQLQDDAEEWVLDQAKPECYSIVEDFSDRGVGATLDHPQQGVLASF